MARRPKFDQEIDGVRVRVYSTRTEYEVIFNDDDIADPKASVWVYPRAIGVWGAAQQGRLEGVEPEHVGGTAGLTSKAPRNEDGTFFYVVTRKSWGREHSHLRRAMTLAEAKKQFGWTRELHTAIQVRRATVADVAELREETSA